MKENQFKALDNACDAAETQAETQFEI